MKSGVALRIPSRARSVSASRRRPPDTLLIRVVEIRLRGFSFDSSLRFSFDDREGPDVRNHRYVVRTLRASFASRPPVGEDRLGSLIFMVLKFGVVLLRGIGASRGARGAQSAANLSRSHRRRAPRRLECRRLQKAPMLHLSASQLSVGRHDRSSDTDGGRSRHTGWRGGTTARIARRPRGAGLKGGRGVRWRDSRSGHSPGARSP